MYKKLRNTVVVLSLLTFMASVVGMFYTQHKYDTTTNDIWSLAKTAPTPAMAIDYSTKTIEHMRKLGVDEGYASLVFPTEMDNLSIRVQQIEAVIGDLRALPREPLARDDYTEPFEVVRKRMGNINPGRFAHLKGNPAAMITMFLSLVPLIFSFIWMIRTSDDY